MKFCFFILKMLSLYVLFYILSNFFSICPCDNTIGNAIKKQSVEVHKYLSTTVFSSFVSKKFLNIKSENNMVHKKNNYESTTFSGEQYSNYRHTKKDNNNEPPKSKDISRELFLDKSIDEIMNPSKDGAKITDVENNEILEWLMNFGDDNPELKKEIEKQKNKENLRLDDIDQKIDDMIK